MKQIHPKLARRVPGLILYRQNLLCQSPGPESSVDSEFDACSEYTYVSEEAYTKAKGTEEWKALDRDSKEFIRDRGHIDSFSVQSSVSWLPVPAQ
ncbi:hypothetical protein I308_104501 [Cryptococcus tetragattii IND107]|uniref:Uncharacterized protein n=1 Tax=Cryptococcus tetragattii IND107 TaxID=1296105 RepID=A0ABR3BMU3_9TREE